MQLSLKDSLGPLITRMVLHCIVLYWSINIWKTVLKDMFIVIIEDNVTVHSYSCAPTAFFNQSWPQKNPKLTTVNSYMEVSCKDNIWWFIFSYWGSIRLSTTAPILLALPGLSTFTHQAETEASLSSHELSFGCWMRATTSLGCVRPEHSFCTGTLSLSHPISCWSLKKLVLIHPAVRPTSSFLRQSKQKQKWGKG